MKPFLKWVGGKTQIIDAIRERIPKDIVNFHEPFLGGGSVLLAVLSDRDEGLIRVGTVYASDVNSTLIRTYKKVQTDVEDLIVQLQELYDEFAALKGVEINRKPETKSDATSQESYYYWIRSQFNLRANKKMRSAMFIFLNKTCFRGVYREGPNGFNVPFGHYKTPTIFDAEHLRAVSRLLEGVVFSCQPFTESLAIVHRGDFVYLDPPYAPINTTTFVGYTANGFDLEEHQSLFARCNELRQDGISLLMSNADVELVTNAFPESAYTIHQLSCRRAINSKNPDAKASEVLISC